MPFDPNQLYFDKFEFFCENKGKGFKIEMCDEGGSRSSKTWDNIHLIYTYCDHNRNKKKDIGIFRDTLVNCKDYTLKEFEKCFAQIGHPLIVSNPQKPYVNLFGNNIYFRGLADESQQEAAPFDVVYINEALDIDSESMISGLKMRCNDLIIFDWNPKFTDHWIFNYEKHPNCLFTHSTYKNNKHLPQNIIREIESYNPNIEENVINGTADEYRWKVYGLGLRASPQGLIFNNVQIIDALPEHYDNQYYGIDFGYTNDPTAIVEVRKVSNELNAKLHVYTPIDNADLLFRTIMNINPKGIYFADSADPGMISSLRRLGLNIFPVAKFAGSIKTGIDIMKRYKLNVVKDPDAQKEINNYKWRMINGINLNEPIDQFNHFWDAFRYAVMSNCI